MQKRILLPSLFVIASVLVLSALTSKINSTNDSKEILDTPSVARRVVADSNFTFPNFQNQIPKLLVKRNENDDASSPLSIRKIDLQVKVTGNIASTIMSITFYNDLPRVLDGEFCFPLGEGQSISYFAMEGANGLQEASVVEKTKGRVVYESIVRKKVDPALLEWTAGNNFRSRIYPIPAKGIKKIIIGFEQELMLAKNSYLYYQPFFFKDKIDEFSIHVQVFHQDVKPLLHGDERVTLEFDRWKEDWVSEKILREYIADKPLAFEIPLNEKTRHIFVEQADKGNSAFYLTFEPTLYFQEKIPPQVVTLIWDVSGSAENSDTASILKCLSAYLKKYNYPALTLVTVSNKINETVRYAAGIEGWKSAVKKVESIQPDGATQLGCIELQEYSCDEFILVSDGLSNFGKNKIKTDTRPFNTLCCSPSADFSYLKYLSTLTGGSYINLNAVSQVEALKLLSSKHYQFISAECNKSVLTQIFPLEPLDVSRNFSIAGMLEGYSSDLVLNFGIGNKILYSERFTIENKPSDYNGMVAKMWAQKKLSQLDVFYEENKTEITNTAKQYGIVTRNTSLLILDRIEDYITYQVVPKDIDMQKKYYASISESKANIDSRNSQHKESVAKQFAEWINWYNKRFEKPKPTATHSSSVDTLPSGEHVFETVEYVAPLVDANAIQGRTVTRDQYQSMATRNVNSVAAQTAGVYQQDEGRAISVRGGRADNSIDGRRNKRGYKEDSDALKSDIELKAWSPDAAYMYELKKTSKESLYSKYLELRKKYKSTPSFFIDVSDYFYAQGEKELALRILSNIAEFDLENPQLLRVLAHRLQQLNQNLLAKMVFENVLKLREEEPQSYRDLGLAYEQNHEYQKAFDMLCNVLNRNWDGRFPEIEVLVAIEINHLIAAHEKELKMDKLDPRLIKSMICDVRVVINWDSDNCDMDLWVTNPSQEKCFYKNSLTLEGGRISRDFTGGYGPEVFMVKDATEGNYKVEVNYFGSTNQSLSGPTTVQAELYTNYGKSNEKKEVITLRLDNSKEVISLANLNFYSK